jgi:hypothetical protein
LDNSNINNIDSSSKLELDRLKQDYEKATLDYNNLLSSDQEQINNFKSTIKSQHNSLKTLTQDISLELDKLFSVSETNKNYNQYFDQYLGAKNFILKNQMKDSVKKLFQQKEYLENLDLEDLNQTKIIEIINIFDQYHNNLEKILNNTKIVIEDSVVSSSFTQNNID